MVESITARIEAAGGLQRYQQASILGQSAERGGDTSKVLMEWLSELIPNPGAGDTISRLRMLEVGALKPDNACSRSGLFEMKRIDLHSQHPDIEQKDFMHMSVPKAENLDIQGFDVVSLSLVVNFVGDSTQRGEMLKRVETFFKSFIDDRDEIAKFMPALFLVLPASCVTNSRYLDEERLQDIMQSIGYIRAKRKMSSKLIYYLWKYEQRDSHTARVFNKKELRSGSSRNNFAIVLR